MEANVQTKESLIAGTFVRKEKQMPKHHWYYDNMNINKTDSPTVLL